MGRGNNRPFWYEYGQSGRRNVVIGKYTKTYHGAPARRHKQRFAGHGVVIRRFVCHVHLGEEIRGGPVPGELGLCCFFWRRVTWGKLWGVRQGKEQHKTGLQTLSGKKPFFKTRSGKGRARTTLELTRGAGTHVVTVERADLVRGFPLAPPAQVLLHGGVRGAVLFRGHDVFAAHDWQLCACWNRSAGAPIGQALGDGRRRARDDGAAGRTSAHFWAVGQGNTGVDAETEGSHRASRRAWRCDGPSGVIWERHVIFFSHFCKTKTTENAHLVFDWVVPLDDMHGTFRTTGGAQKRRDERYTRGLGSLSVRGENRCVCAPERRTNPTLKIRKDPKRST